MAHISYSKKNWTDTSSSGNTLNAASLNNIENGIANSVNKINSIDDKISTVDKIYCGSVVRTIRSNREIKVFTASDFKRHFGKSFNSGTDCVVVSNGDWLACPYYIGSSIFTTSDDSIWAKAFEDYDGVERKIRINFIVALGTINYTSIEDGWA